MTPENEKLLEEMAMAYEANIGNGGMKAALRVLVERLDEDEGAMTFAVLAQWLEDNSFFRTADKVRTLIDITEADDG